MGTHAQAQAEGQIEAFLTDDGLELCLGRWGQPQWGSVILLHGGGQTRHAWGNSAARLAAAGWEALALDLRGHGDSQWSPSGDYALSRMARDVEGIARTLAHRPVLVGASMGGMTALYALGRMNPDLAQALAGGRLAVLDTYMDGAVINPEAVVTAALDDGL